MQWGIGESVLRYIARNAGEGSTTLETGGGVSTILFALLGARHISINPGRDQIERLKSYCGERAISLERVEFVVAKSEDYLPAADLPPLDLALIDGDHAFPVPFLDWFYVQRALRPGGILINDDVHMWTGRVLADFLRAEPEWKVDARFMNSIAFRKLREACAKEWHDQPYVAARSEGERMTRLRTALDLLRRGRLRDLRSRLRRAKSSG